MKIGRDSRYLTGDFNKNKVDEVMNYKRTMALKPADEVYPR